MQTSKFLLVIGAAMIFSAPSLLAATPETEAQAKMRAALRLKMEELNTQESPLTPPVVEASEPVPTPAPVAKPQVKPVAPKPVKVKAEPAKRKTVVVPVPVEAPAKAEFSEPVSDADTAAAARMKAALDQKMAELDAKPAAVVVAPAPVAKPQQKVVVAPAKPAVLVTPAPAKFEAPASPLPVTKQDRLAALLSRYKADQLTAQDYHTQRAAILAEK